MKVDEDEEDDGHRAFAALLEQGLEEARPAYKSVEVEPFTVSHTHRLPSLKRPLQDAQDEGPLNAFQPAQSKLFIQPRKRRRPSAPSPPGATASAAGARSAGGTRSTSSPPRRDGPPGERPSKSPSVTARALPLPPELVLYVLRFLSPADLTNASQVCRQWREIGSNPRLWRAQYCTRWPESANTGADASSLGGEHARGRGVNWRLRYFERDSVEIRAAIEGVQGPDRQLYLQLEAAKRQKEPDGRWLAKRELLMQEENGSELKIKELVRAYKRSVGLPERWSQPGHRCSRRFGCTYQLVYSSEGTEVLVCETTGNVHVCDLHCEEIEWDPDTNMHVCCISGKCHTLPVSGPEEERQMMMMGSHQRSVHQGEAEQEEGEAEQENGAGGTFGRAFMAGYCAMDEQDILCGW